MSVGATATFDLLDAERQNEVGAWRVRRIVLAGGPSLIVMKATDYEDTISLRDALKIVDDEAWIRRAELHLDDGRVLVLQGGRTWVVPDKETAGFNP